MILIKNLVPRLLFEFFICSYVYDQPVSDKAFFSAPYEYIKKWNEHLGTELEYSSIQIAGPVE